MGTSIQKSENPLAVPVESTSGEHSGNISSGHS